MPILDAEKIKRDLIAEVEFQIQHRAKAVVASKINFNFNPSDWNKKSWEMDISRLAEAENRLKVLTNMDTEKPAIVKWALE